MAATLTSLPIEVTDLIAKELPWWKNDLLKLRSVCRDLYVKTFRRVGQEYFTTIRRDLSNKSLQKLKDISKHEQLRHHVRVLFIDADSPDDFGSGISWPRHSSGHLSAPLPVIEILRDVLLGGLVNCRSFNFQFDYHNLSTSHSHDDYRLSEDDTVALIFAVIADTGLPVESFHMPISDWVYEGSIDMSRIDCLQYHTPQFRDGWAHLQELQLNHVFTPDDLDWTSGLVLGAPNLRKLEIFNPWDPEEAFFSFLIASPLRIHHPGFKISLFHGQMLQENFSLE